MGGGRKGGRALRPLAQMYDEPAEPHRTYHRKAAISAPQDNDAYPRYSTLSKAPF